METQTVSVMCLAHPQASASANGNVVDANHAGVSLEASAALTKLVARRRCVIALTVNAAPVSVANLELARNK